jgi:hypothetical protein
MSEENTVKADELEVAIREAFDASNDEAKSEDEIKMDMIAAGATFKNVTRLFNQFMIDAGLAVSKDEKNEIVESTLEGRDFSTEEGLQDATDALMDALVGSTERSASSLVRGYAKKNDLEVYTKPKSAGKAGFATKFYDYLIANPKATKEDVTAFVNGTDGNDETSANVQKHLSHYLNIFDLVAKIRTA